MFQHEKSHSRQMPIEAKSREKAPQKSGLELCGTRCLALRLSQIPIEPVPVPYGFKPERFQFFFHVKHLVSSRHLPRNTLLMYMY